MLDSQLKVDVPGLTREVVEKAIGRTQNWENKPPYIKMMEEEEGWIYAGSIDMSGKFNGKRAPKLPRELTPDEVRTTFLDLGYRDAMLGPAFTTNGLVLNKDFPYTRGVYLKR